MAGAKAYIMKQETSSTVITAIRTVMSGKLFVSENLMSNMLDTLRGVPQPAWNSPTEILTQREMEVFRNIGRGLSTRDIAEKLELGLKTVGTYRERIKEKLNLKNANELITQAARWVANH
jgi:DNA-binding NarL/FixJ family response regulator